MVKKFLGIATVLLLVGCEENIPVYSAFSEHNTTAFDCLNYGAMDERDQKSIEAALGIPHDPQCDCCIQLIRYYVGKCDNPLVKSLGSDFDGYIRLEVRKGLEVEYKVQSDFQNDSEAAYTRVLDRAANDIGHNNCN